MKTVDIDKEIQELYGAIECEGEWEIGKYLYHFIMGDIAGWNVYIEEMASPDEKWFENCPHEHFDSKMDVITQFHIRDDGRTFLEYLCDVFGEPYVLVPPTPEDYVKDSKYN